MQEAAMRASGRNPYGQRGQKVRRVYLSLAMDRRCSNSTDLPLLFVSVGLAMIFRLNRTKQSITLFLYSR